jgi:hypothetical protein
MTGISSIATSVKPAVVRSDVIASWWASENMPPGPNGSPAGS